MEKDLIVGKRELDGEGLDGREVCFRWGRIGL